MSEKYQFQSFKELIDRIIGDLKDSEILMIKNADPMGIHFALDRWIKSEFLSNAENNIKKLVSKKILENDSSNDQNSDLPLNIHPDDLSGFIIQEIINKIKG